MEVGDAGIRDRVGRAGDRGSDVAGNSSRTGIEVTPGRVAQLAEHSALNRQVVGSTPTAPTKICQSCEGEMIQVRGFWACPELTCSLCGQQQGRVN